MEAFTLAVVLTLCNNCSTIARRISAACKRAFVPSAFVSTHLHASVSSSERMTSSSVSSRPIACALVEGTAPFQLGEPTATLLEVVRSRRSAWSLLHCISRACRLWRSQASSELSAPTIISTRSRASTCSCMRS
eukprot:scaffold307922_cov27-Tisochrysis_lutea.AAC.2